MKLGVVVPQFRHDTAATFAVADAAERLGLDGIFTFDHLWPMGKTHGPALAGLPVSAAILARTERVHVGTLVTRVGIADDEVTVGSLRTLHELGGRRLIAGLGVGDRLSKPENVAYGIGWQPREARLERLDSIARALSSNGVEVWLGGRSAEVESLARSVGVPVNKWQAEPEALCPGDTWGGRVPLDGRRIQTTLEELQGTGATWAVLLVEGSGREPLAAVEAVASARY